MLVSFWPKLLLMQLLLLRQHVTASVNVCISCDLWSLLLLFSHRIRFSILFDEPQTLVGRKFHTSCHMTHPYLILSNIHYFRKIRKKLKHLVTWANIIKCEKNSLSLCLYVLCVKIKYSPQWWYLMMSKKIREIHIKMNKKIFQRVIYVWGVSVHV